MKISLITLLACLLFFFTSTTSAQSLYAIVTLFAGNDTETVVYAVSIDPSTGDLKPLVETFIYAGGSGTFTGISTFDTDQNVLYYVTDFSSDFIFSADVVNKVLLPPVSVGGVSVERLKYDDNQKRLILWVAAETEQETFQFYIVSYSTSRGPASLLANVTTTDIMSIAIDSKDQLLYFVTGNWSLGTVDLQTSQISTIASLSCPDNYGLEYLTYDPVLATLWAITVKITPKGEIDYYLLQITTSGSCTGAKLAMKEKGIVMDFTYDPTIATLYYNVIGNKGSMLVSLDVSTNTIVNEFLIANGTVIEDLEVAY